MKDRMKLSFPPKLRVFRVWSPPLPPQMWMLNVLFCFLSLNLTRVWPNSWFLMLCFPFFTDNSNASKKDLPLWITRMYQKDLPNGEWMVVGGKGRVKFQFLLFSCNQTQPPTRLTNNHFVETNGALMGNLLKRILVHNPGSPLFFILSICWLHEPWLVLCFGVFVLQLEERGELESYGLWKNLLSN
jgi:hypothetical protein